MAKPGCGRDARMPANREVEIKLLTIAISNKYGVLLKNVEAAAVLRVPNWKLSEISRELLPRSFGRGRGGLRIQAAHLATYIIDNTEYAETGREGAFSTGHDLPKAA